MSDELDNIEVVYFLGIGGIGMSSIARYFHSKGLDVSGYDKTPSPLTREMESEGIRINHQDSVYDLPATVRVSSKEKVLVIYTPAIPKKHPQLKFFEQEKYQLIKRARALGMLSNAHKTVAIAGTHGKTSTSAMLAHLVKDGGHGCLAFLGGVTANYESNVLLSDKPELCVVEADEFDRSFLTLQPAFAVITSMDADHLDIYENPGELVQSFQDFIKRIPSGGTLLIKKGLPYLEREDITILNYSIDEDADFTARNIRIENGQYVFDFHYPGGRIRDIHCGLSGRHNVENAVAAITAYMRCGFQDATIPASMESFKGVRRRFEYRCRSEEFIFIDDYAHHPRELSACIRSVKELHGNKKITGVFQPHLYSRTRDFADEFARSLALLDEIILLPIYPAREEAIPGVDSQMLLDKIQKAPKKLLEKNELLDQLRQDRPEVLLTLGAGDIDRLIEPLQNILCH